MGLNLIHNQNCRLGDNPCYLYSLPNKTKYLDYPICPNATTEQYKKRKKCSNYFGDVFSGKKGGCKDLTPCFIQVYGMQESKVGPGMYQRLPETLNEQCKFYLDLDSPDSTHGSYSDFKSVFIKNS